MTPLKFVFMGTPIFALPAFDSMITAGHEPLCVYSQPPRPAGRGRTSRNGPMIEAAKARNVQSRTPKTLKDIHETQSFLSLAPDVAVVAAYGLILPKAVLEAPRLGCINIHASLLPRWRGAAPIQRSIMACDRVTGITIMHMDKGLDTGPILAQHEICIGSDDAGRLHDRLAKVGAEMIVETLEKMEAGNILEMPQPESGATYASRLSAEDERLDWHRPSIELECQVRGLSPRPGAHFTFAGERWKVLSATVKSAPSGTKPGYVLDDQLTVACAAGAIQPSKVQRPSRRPMSTSEALRGTPIPPGTQLG